MVANLGIEEAGAARARRRGRAAATAPPAAAAPARAARRPPAAARAAPAARPAPATAASGEAPKPQEAAQPQAREAALMGLLVWIMVGLALWHFTIFLPDHFWAGIVGAFVGALVGSVIFGLIINLGHDPGAERHRPADRRRGDPGRAARHGPRVVDRRAPDRRDAGQRRVH